MYQVKTSIEMGRGLYANQAISKGTIIALCELLVLSELDTIAVNKTELQYYTFVYNEKQDCLVLGHGEIFNHDDKPNVSYHLSNFDGRKVMVFTALDRIEKGFQLFIDYSQDTKVNVENYIQNESLTESAQVKEIA